jgi:hypothetical protein
MSQTLRMRFVICVSLRWGGPRQVSELESAVLWSCVSLSLTQKQPFEEFVRPGRLRETHFRANVLGIHVLAEARKTWMAGASPAMTNIDTRDG